LYEEEDASAFLDLLNLLYVGTTRPEDMLYILSTQVKRLPEKNNSVTALLINYLSVKGLWDGFKNYEFGDVNTVRLKKAGNGHEKGSYISERAGSALKGARQITIKRNSKLLWNDEGLETRDK
jgi:ATP-dependent exoDNAse (exonuclease V) beta subunit